MLAGQRLDGTHLFSRVCLSLDAALALACLTVGIASGDPALLLAAAGLALLAPMWFLHPVSLTKPINESIRQHGQYWRLDVVLTVLGAGMLLGAVVMFLARLF